MNTKNYSLLLMLKNFQGATEKQDENEKLTTLALQFMNMAEKIILGGYFEVNGVRRIYPLEIEFYYHEESDGGLKVCNYDGENWVVEKKCEKRSTYIYEDMFMKIPLFNGININWVSSESVDPLKEIYVKPRINVAEYEKDKEGKYKKVDIPQDEYDKISDDKKKEYFTYSKKKLKKCSRMWNYSVIKDDYE